jgi:hypothetical protein
MVEKILINTDDVDTTDIELLVTEDDTPVDNFGSARLQRFLVSSLYSSLPERIFLAEANVAIYHIDGTPAIVPDVLISFDVQTPVDWWTHQNRCYFVRKFGKVPEVVIEIVSNQKGGELEEKLKIYEKMRVIYYIVYDPNHQLGTEVLRIYQLQGKYYVETSETWLAEVNLGVTLWYGEFEGRQDTWLRWCHQDGTLLFTGDELAKQEKLRTEQEKLRTEQEKLRAENAEQRAEQEKLRAENAEQRAEQEKLRTQLLLARLELLGIDPESL